MKKGQTGILLPYIAAVAFLLAIFNQTLLCGLVLIFALVVEKDEWLNIQVLQAFLLTFVFSIVSRIGNVFSYSYFSSSFLNTFFGVIDTIFSVISGLLWLVVLVIAIIAIINCLKGKDAAIPLISTLARKAFGIVAPKKEPVQPTYHAPQNYQAPPVQVPNQAPNQVPNQMPVQPSPQVPVQPPVVPQPTTPEQPPVQENKQ